MNRPSLASSMSAMPKAPAVIPAPDEDEDGVMVPTWISEASNWASEKKDSSTKAVAQLPRAADEDAWESASTATPSPRRDASFDSASLVDEAWSTLDLIEIFENCQGVWFHADGSYMGEIDGGLMTWNDARAPTELHPRPGGEVCITVGSETYIGVLSGDELRWNDGNTWIKGVEHGTTYRGFKRVAMARAW